ncbi:hypothetical protein [Streptomyces sp. NPDC056337]|uniref:hypothetical protein n=1 Tax=Streptomyces sp. NPDC056337 TaxID=3345787 RepID=UPI0035D87C38
MTKHSATSTFGRKLAHSGPHHVPIGVTGPAQFTEALQENRDRQAWDVRQYEPSAALKSAVESRDIDGGLALTAQGVDVHSATAGGPSATGAITELGNRVAAEQGARAAVHDLVPVIFGGMFPALFLKAVLTGAAVAAFLQFVTESVAGDYGLTALGIVLGLTALSTTLIGLQACLGVTGLALGGALVMLLGDPLSDGQGGGLPALVLTAWVVAGVSLVLVADRQGRTKPSHAAGGRHVPALLQGARPC